PDARVVEERAVLVDEDPLGEVEVQPVVGEERRVDRHARRQGTPEDLLEQARPAVLVVERQDVEPRRELGRAQHALGHRAELGALDPQEQVAGHPPDPAARQRATASRAATTSSTTSTTPPSPGEAAIRSPSAALARA